MHWLGRDRFVLSAGHSSLTLYIQLYLGGFWLELTDIPKERIVRRDRLDNYWHMGIPGPGGPCSEIFVDRGP